MLYIDEYALVDLDYVVHAIPVNPGDAPETDANDALHQYGIGIILHVGPQCCPVLHWYPTQGLRDAAFEQLCGLMRRQDATLYDLETEEDDA
jgi:hypothetical protein